MKKIKSDCIEIIDSQLTESQAYYQFLYHQLIYSIALDPLDCLDQDKINLLNQFIHSNNSTVLNPLKVKFNHTYLIFKVRYQFNRIKENFIFTAVPVITRIEPEI